MIEIAGLVVVIVGAELFSRRKRKAGAQPSPSWKSEPKAGRFPGWLGIVVMLFGAGMICVPTAVSFFTGRLGTNYSSPFYETTWEPEELQLSPVDLSEFFEGSSSKTTTYTLDFGDGELAIELPDNWETDAYDDFVVSYPFDDYSVSVDYMESWIGVGEEENLKKEKKSDEQIYECTAQAYVFEDQGYTGYAISFVAPAADYRIVDIYRNLGADSYLEIYIWLYDGECSLEELIGTLCTNTVYVPGEQP